MENNTCVRLLSYQSVLTYNIVSMMLTGTIDLSYFNERAFSGGRAGTRTKGAVNPILANNPFLTGHKHNEKDSKDSGGALPMGLYTLKNHEHTPDWIRLIPKNQNQMHGRDGFAIHKHGPRGSDGCIVPNNNYTVTTLYKLVKKHKDEDLGDIVLKVVAIGDLDNFYPYAQIS